MAIENESYKFYKFQDCIKTAVTTSETRYKHKQFN